LLPVEGEEIEGVFHAKAEVANANSADARRVSLEFIGRTFENQLRLQI
jgi:hypothetical protein